LSHVDERFQLRRAELSQADETFDAGEPIDANQGGTQRLTAEAPDALESPNQIQLIEKIVLKPQHNLVFGRRLVDPLIP